MSHQTHHHHHNHQQQQQQQQQQYHHHDHHPVEMLVDGTTIIEKNKDVMDHEKMFQTMTTGSMDHMGKMFFHFGYEPIVLIETWAADSDLSLWATCLFFFVMAIIYEILKAYRRLNSFRVLQMQRETLKQQFRRQNVKLTSNSSEILDGSKMESIIATDPTEQMNSFVGNHPSYGMTSQTDLDSSSSSRTTNTNSNEPINSSNVHFSVDPMLPAAPATTTTATAASPSLSSSLNNRKSLPLFATIGQMFSRTNLYSTLLYSLQVFFAYYLMLAFMLFNVWICLSIVLGAAFGHFLLAEHSTTLADHNVEDYCH